MTVSVPTVPRERFVFMHLETLNGLRREKSAESIGDVLNRKEFPRYTRYKGCKVITCNELPVGAIVSTIPQDIKNRLRRVFANRHWPVPDVLM